MIWSAAACSRTFGGCRIALACWRLEFHAPNSGLRGIGRAWAPQQSQDNQPTPINWVKDVLYGLGNEMTQIKFADLPSPLRHYTETRS